VRFGGRSRAAVRLILRTAKLDVDLVYSLWKP
jgi:hypothetical protein